MRNQFLRISTSVFVLAAAGAFAGHSSPAVKERLGVILKRQHEARERFNNDLKGKTTAEAQGPAIERYLAETEKNTEEALKLARANPTEPAAVEALEFQGCTGRRARPGGHVIAGRGGGQEPCALVPGIRGGASWKLATRLLSPGGPDRLGRPSMPAQVRASSTWRHRSFPDLPEGPRLDLGPLLLAQV